MTIGELTTTLGGSIMWKRVFEHTETTFAYEVIDLAHRITRYCRLEFTGKAFHGYYATDTETLSISGLTPITWGELSVYLIYVCQAFLGESVPVGTLVDWVDMLCQLYELPIDVVQHIGEWIVLAGALSQ